MPESMTPKQRWLAAIHMEPVDRLPFCPKLDWAYPRAQNDQRLQALDFRLQVARYPFGRPTAAPEV